MYHAALKSPPDPSTVPCTCFFQSIALRSLLHFPGSFTAQIYYSLLFPKYTLLDAWSVKNGSLSVFSTELLQTLLLVEGRSVPVCKGVAYLGGRVFGEGKVKGRKGRQPRAPRPLPGPLWKLKLKPLGYLPSQVTWMRNGPRGSCDRSRGEYKRIHLLSWQEICSLILELQT